MIYDQTVDHNSRAELFSWKHCRSRGDFFTEEIEAVIGALTREPTSGAKNLPIKAYMINGHLDFSMMG